MSVFEKILVPLDGSEHSLHALEKAVQIAIKFDGKITLINVYSISAFRLTPSQVYEYVLEIRKSGEAILAEGEKIAKAEGAQVELIDVIGREFVLNDLGQPIINNAGEPITRPILSWDVKYSTD